MVEAEDALHPPPSSLVLDRARDSHFAVEAYALDVGSGAREAGTRQRRQPGRNSQTLLQHRGGAVAGRGGHFRQSALLAQSRASSTKLSLVLSLAIEVSSFHSMVLGMVPGCLASKSGSLALSMILGAA